MEDVVAVEILLRNGESRFFITWGRIQDTVDPRQLEALVLSYCRGYSLGDEPVKASVCLNLQAARDQPYFYEALIRFAGQSMDRSDSREEFESKRDQVAKEMAAGRHLYFLG